MLGGRIPRPSASFWCMKPRFGACSLVLAKLLVSLDRQIVGNLGQFRCADFKNQCYTAKYRGIQPRFGAYSLVLVPIYVP